MSIRFVPLSLTSQTIYSHLETPFFGPLAARQSPCPAVVPVPPQPGCQGTPAPAAPVQDVSGSAALPSVPGSCRRLGSTPFPQRKTLQTKAEMWFAKIFDNTKRCLAGCQKPYLKSEIQHAPAPGAIPTQPGRATAAPGHGDGAEGPSPPILTLLEHEHPHSSQSCGRQTAPLLPR